MFEASAARKTLAGHKKKVHTLGWNSTGRMLASGSSDGSVRVWNAADGACRAELVHPKKRSAIMQLFWNPVHEDVLAAVGPDGCLDVWDVRTGKVKETIGNCGELISVAWSPDGTCVALSDRDDHLRVVDAKSWKITKQQKLPFEVDEMAWHPDAAAHSLFLATGAGTVAVYTMPGITPLHSFAASTAPLEIVRFDGSGSRFAVGGADDTYSLWDARECACLRMFCGLHNTVRTLSFSHDGQYIAAGAETLLDEARIPTDNFLDICMTETGQSVQQIATGAGVSVVAFNPKQLMLAWCVSEDPSIYLLAPSAASASVATTPPVVTPALLASPK